MGKYLISNMVNIENKDNNSKDIDLISLREASDISRYTPEYLNLLSRQGILRAKKIGRNWYTTKEWLAELIDHKVERARTIRNKKIEELDREAQAQKNLGKDEEAGINEIQNQQSNISILPESAEAKFNWSGLMASILATAIIIPFFAVGNYLLHKYDWKNYLLGKIQGVSNIRNYEPLKIYNENFEEGIVLGEETGTATGNEFAKSENYKLKQINLGGDIILASSFDNVPLQIEEIKSEPIISGSTNASKTNQKDKSDGSKILVSWKTNKLSISEISYFRNGSTESKSISEKSYGFNHSVILSELEEGASYVYQIKCKDRWGNEKASNYFGIITASKPVSVFDLISGAMNETFGWAIKK